MGVDEMPVVMLGGLAITGMTRVDYAEDRTDAVFMIGRTDGVLTFRSSPDYETKNTYMVTVKADDGENTAMKEVTVTVTDVDDMVTRRPATR